MCQNTDSFRHFLKMQAIYSQHWPILWQLCCDKGASPASGAQTR